MNAEELEIARRLVACKGWAWLPGMQAVNSIYVRRVLRVDGERALMGYQYETRSHWHYIDPAHYQRREGPRERAGHADFDEGRGLGALGIPDLSDDLTRLGVLAVVRRAWGDKTASVRAVDCYPLSATWTWIAGQPGVRRVGHERTELAALLAALEAAP